MGSTNARLNFKGSAEVNNNTMNGAQSNVYLDVDSELVVNADSLNNGKKIGITIQDLKNPYWAGVMTALEEVLKEAEEIRIVLSDCGCTAEDLEEKIAQFKEEGCVLFQ